mmetsp:Transcript_17902/g.57292  ORF Transcript_17902/g.57292 Transcript_17902/m.57292 type:complete len:132 (+) Transcript_17902:110-505(+)
MASCTSIGGCGSPGDEADTALCHAAARTACDHWQNLDLAKAAVQMCTRMDVTVPLVLRVELLRERHRIAVYEEWDEARQLRVAHFRPVGARSGPLEQHARTDASREGTQSRAKGKSEAPRSQPGGVLSENV